MKAIEKIITAYNEAIFDTDREQALAVVREAVADGVRPEDESVLEFFSHTAGFEIAQCFRPVLRNLAGRARFGLAIRRSADFKAQTHSAQQLGAARVAEPHVAGNAAPVVDPGGASATRNARIDVVFVSPESM